MGEIETTQQAVGEGKYLYCIVNSNLEKDFGEMGVEDNRAYVIPFKDIGIVVHNCMAKPYESKDENRVKGWILAHHYIIDMTSKNFTAVIPFTFDTIIKGNEENVKEWLEKEYHKLKNELEKVKNKSEFTVQIFLDQNLIAQKIENENEKVKELKRGIETKPKGVAYILKQKLEMMLKDELIIRSNEYAEDFYNQIRKCVDDIKIEKLTKLSDKYKDKQMILNVSCLMHKNKVKELGDILGKINDMDTFDVRFTGPWAPYSFVGIKSDQK